MLQTITAPIIVLKVIDVVPIMFMLLQIVLESILVFVVEIVFVLVLDLPIVFVVVKLVGLMTRQQRLQIYCTLCVRANVFPSPPP